MDDSPTHTDLRRRTRVWDLLGLAALALVLRLPAYFAQRSLTFDDGVFANSAVAMRHGGVPFRDVFSSQGPLFLPLVWLGDLLGGRSLDSTRLLAVASGVAAVMLTYLVALRVRDRLAALVAGALVATSGAFMWVTGPLAADGPALAFAVGTVLLALRMRDDPTVPNAIWLGLGAGAVLSTKSLEAPVLAVVALVLLAPVVSAARRGRIDWPAVRRGVVATASSMVVFMAVTIPFGFADVWDQSVVYRTDAASQRDIPATAGKLISTMWDRDLALLFFAAVTLGWAILARHGDHSGPGRSDDVGPTATAGADPTDWVPSGRLLVITWLAVTFVWLVFVVSPLWRPHVAAMTIPLALVIAVHRPPARICAVAGVVAVPLVFVQLDGLLSPGDYSGTRAELYEALSELPGDSIVLSDEPGVVWRSGNRTTDDLVDPSMLRREQGRYDADSLLAEATPAGVCAFVRYSSQRFAHFEQLPDRLGSVGYEAVPEVGDGSVLLVRPGCAPPA